MSQVICSPALMSATSLAFTLYSGGTRFPGSGLPRLVRATSTPNCDWRATMTSAEIVAELKKLGKASQRKVLLNHGIQEPLFGVSVEDLKKFQKRIKKNYQLA